MKIYDLSPEINSNMVVYRDKPENIPKLRIIRKIGSTDEKAVANESVIEIYAHTGSHVDAPYHFLEDGNTIDEIGLEKFFGEAVVLDFTSEKDSIRKSGLEKFEKEIKEGIIILLKTKNKIPKTFDFGFTYLEKSGAEYLASKKVKAVALDSLSIERNQPDYGTHKELLSNAIPIFEGLNLSKVKPGKYIFYGFPLRIGKCDGSPIRAVLVDMHS